MRLRWQGSSRKACEDLGYTIRPLDETLRPTIDWHLELIERGTFDGAESASPRTLVAATLRGGERLGMTRLLGPLESLAGTRLVACSR